MMVTRLWPCDSSALEKLKFVCQSTYPCGDGSRSVVRTLLAIAKFFYLLQNCLGCPGLSRFECW